MNWHGLILLAQSDRFSDLGGRFQEGGTDLTRRDVVVMAAAIVGISLGMWALARFLGLRDRRGHRNSRRLFTELCRKHSLDWPSRKLLQQLAAMHGMPFPAQLFLQPEKFDPHQLAPILQPFAEQIGELRSRLFQATDSDRADVAQSTA